MQLSGLRAAGHFILVFGWWLNNATGWRTGGYCSGAIGHARLPVAVKLPKLSDSLRRPLPECRSVGCLFRESEGASCFRAFSPLHCPVGPMVGADCKTALSKTHIMRGFAALDQTKKQFHAGVVVVYSQLRWDQLLQMRSFAAIPVHTIPLGTVSECVSVSALLPASRPKTRIFTFHRLKSRALVTGCEGNRTRQPQCRVANNGILSTAQLSPTSGIIKNFTPSIGSQCLPLSVPCFLSSFT